MSSSRSYDLARDARAIRLIEAGTNATTSAASMSQINVVLNRLEELKQRVPIE